MPNDRQRYRRSAVFLPAKVTVGDESFYCDVLNISAGGALIRTGGPAELDGELTIDIEGFDTLKAEVVRATESNLGIAFHEDPKVVGEKVAALLAAAPHKREKRHYPRRLVLLAVSFYVGDQFVQGKVHNISAGGVLVKADVLPEPQQMVELNLARFGVMPARVVWADDVAMGASFVDSPHKIVNRIGHLLPKQSGGAYRG